MADEKQSNELFERGVSSFIDPEGLFRKKLEKNPKNIVIKFGVDPTRPDLHLGHAVVLRKLRQFQDLGCKVVFLIGDFTSQIGDPSGKSKIRPEINQAEIEVNMKTYLDQVGKILSLDPAVFSWIRNSDWFVNVSDVSAVAGTKLEMEIENNGQKTKVPIDANSFIGKAILYDNTRMQKTHLKKNIVHTVSFARILSTLRHITHARLIDRDMFQDRMKDGGELYMHEMLYPVLQGIDSAVLTEIYDSCDMEVGGSDQTFNMLVGRDVMKINKREPQAVLSFDIIVGTDGKEKMSKSLDNYVAITDEPTIMYGKIMSVPDSALASYFTLATFTPKEEIESMENDIQKGKLNPRDAKMKLARQIVEIYHGSKEGERAEKHFIDTFQKKEIPIDLKEITGDGDIAEALVNAGIVESKTDLRRLIDGGAITHLEKEITAESLDYLKENKGTYRIGKKRFIKII